MDEVFHQLQVKMKLLSSWKIHYKNSNNKSNQHLWYFKSSNHSHLQLIY